MGSEREYGHSRVFLSFLLMQVCNAFRSVICAAINTSPSYLMQPHGTETVSMFDLYVPWQNAPIVCSPQRKGCDQGARSKYNLTSILPVSGAPQLQASGAMKERPMSCWYRKV